MIASAERSFSKLKLIKNLFKVYYAQEKLSGLVILLIEKKI